MITLSIIVPVYGVECFILSFANSLIKQLNENVELIIIDDGSQDKSIANIKQFICENNFSSENIVFLEQVNQGQSAARNYGISVAKGRYITFLDPDDMVKSNYIELILDVLTSEKNIDILEFNADIVKNIKNKIIKVRDLKLCEKSGFYDNDFDTRKKLINSRHWYSWLRVFRREMIPEDLFPKGYIFEDIMALPFLYSEDIAVYGLNQSLVNYFLHENSSVSKPSLKIVESAKHGIEIYKHAVKNDEIFLGKYVDFIEIYSKHCIKYYGLFEGIRKSSQVVKVLKINHNLRDINSFYVGNLFKLNLFLYYLYLCTVKFLKK
ncbi:glycosyltransferase [Acinetobacter sp. YH12233]|uniref:glycosyltransferase n=1 Tax=Acinetobacter sp. YH12233 TaxID=2601161 RepID=UPI0015D3F8F4|nr:glycosyltransferase [Acinetobacter sp. YH12233]